MILESEGLWSSSVFLALPFGALGIATLGEPSVLVGIRLIASLCLFAATAASILAGWPRRQRVRIDDAGRVTSPNGRVLCEKIQQLVLSSIRTADVRSPDRLYELAALDAQGTSCSVLRVEDPRLAIAAMRESYRRFRIPMVLRVNALGTLPRLDVALPDRASGSRSKSAVRSAQPHFIVWLGWGGAGFVWIVEASLAHGHWQRGGSFSAVSLLLLAALALIALVLPHAALRSRLRAIAPRTGDVPNADHPAPLFEQLVVPGLLGIRVIASRGHATDPQLLLSAAPGEPQYLLWDESGRLEALCLPCLSEEDTSWHAVEI